MSAQRRFSPSASSTPRRARNIIRRRSLQDAVFALGLGALVLTAAACGGGAASPGVAHIGAGHDDVLSRSAAGPSVTSVRGLQADELAFARCMRSHGEPGSPTRVARELSRRPSHAADLNFSSPLFQAAQQRVPEVPAQRRRSGSCTAGGRHGQEPSSSRNACVPTGSPISPTLEQGSTATGGYFVEAQNGPLSPSNPQFVRAQKTCQELAGWHLLIRCLALARRFRNCRSAWQAIAFQTSRTLRP